MSERPRNCCRISISTLLVTALLTCTAIPWEAKAADKAPPADHAEIKAVRAAWQKRFDLCRSWRCTADAKLVWIKGSAVDADDPDISPQLAAFLKVTGGFPQTDMSRPNPFVWTMDREAHRYRHEETCDVLLTEALKFTSEFRVRGCNGTILWRDFPKKMDGDQIRDIDLFDPNQCTIDLCQYPLFFTFGLFPHQNERLDWRHLEKSSATPLKLVRDGTAEIAGARCLRIKNKTEDGRLTYLFYADPQRDYAILRWELITPEGLHHAADISDYRRQSGLYLPFHWKAAHHSGGGFELPQEPAVRENFVAKVTRYDINTKLEKSLFEIPTDGVMNIRDQRPKNKKG